MSNLITVYIFHGIDSVVISFFRGDKFLNSMNILKKELGEKLVEGFCSLMDKIKINLSDIESIYLSNSFSTWNASRLITLFVKTITSFREIAFYLREESQDKLDVASSLKSFEKERNSFRCVDKTTDVISPLYKKCQNINI